MSKRRVRFFSFLPALIIMGLIFYFSAQPSDDSEVQSMGLARQLVILAGNLSGQVFSAARIEALTMLFDGTIRKIAHMVEYGALCLSLYYPLRSAWDRIVRAGIAAVLFSALYGATDELHQRFVPGRAGVFKDVLIDGAGALIFGLVLGVLPSLIRQALRQRAKRKAAALAEAGPERGLEKNC